MKIRSQRKVKETFLLCVLFMVLFSPAKCADADSGESEKSNLQHSEQSRDKQSESLTETPVPDESEETNQDNLKNTEDNSDLQNTSDSIGSTTPLENNADPNSLQNKEDNIPSSSVPEKTEDIVDLPNFEGNIPSTSKLPVEKPQNVGNLGSRWFYNRQGSVSEKSPDSGNLPKKSDYFRSASLPKNSVNVGDIPHKNENMNANAVPEKPVYNLFSRNKLDNVRPSSKPEKVEDVGKLEKKEESIPVSAVPRNPVEVPPQTKSTAPGPDNSQLHSPVDSNKDVPNQPENPPPNFVVNADPSISPEDNYASSSPVKPDDAICPDSENPLNVDYPPITEVLVNGTTLRNVEPLGLEFINPADVACEKNHDNIKADDLKNLVLCALTASNKVSCRLDSGCYSYRREYLQRMRLASKQALEVVLKLKGIRFFNKYLGVKQMIFGTQPLAPLSWQDIVQRATTGHYSILSGFSTPKHIAKPTREEFEQVFGKAINLFLELNSAGEPTGSLNHTICSVTSESDKITMEDMEPCPNMFVENLKDKSKLKDYKLITLIENSLDLVLSYFSNGEKRFSKLKIPFGRPCLSAEPKVVNSSYKRLSHTLEALKNMP